MSRFDADLTLRFNEVPFLDRFGQRSLPPVPLRAPGPARVRTALMGGIAANRILEAHAERMVERPFAPGFRIGLHQRK